MTTKDCLHRFCSECITTALLRGNKECPTCRKKLVSKRGLRPDKNFDALIAKIWPDRQVLEKMQQLANERFAQRSNLEALQKSIEAGMKAQALNRRQRVQGSYDYEKRKRRPKKDAAGEPEPEVAENGGSADSVNGTDAGDSSDSSSDSDSDSSDSSSDSSSSSEDSSHNSPAIGINATQEPGPSGSSASHQAPPVLTPQVPIITSGPPSMSSQNQTSKAPPALTPTTALQGITHPAGPVVSMSGNTVVVAPGFCVDRMQKWLNDTPNSPLVPAEDNISEANSDASEMRFDEVEFELAPAKSLLKRKGIPKCLMTHRYVAASADSSLEYVSEFLSRFIKDSGAKPIKIEFFYVVNQNNQMRKIFMHDTISKAFSVARGQHLIIYFDSASPDMDACDNLFTHIVNEDGASIGGETSSTTSTDPADEPMDTSQ
ncbi:hypothetical protein L596_026404 [Steinernema carpocapsae]|nr:hypothetical protein L596_026404 [Steinernema carpocapsae]